MSMASKESEVLQLLKFRECLRKNRCELGQTPVSRFAAVAALSGLLVVGYTVMVVSTLFPNLTNGLFRGIFDRHLCFQVIFVPNHWAFYILYIGSIIFLVFTMTYIAMTLRFSARDPPVILDPPIFVPTFLVLMDVGLVLSIFHILLVESTSHAIIMLTALLAALVFLVATSLLISRYNAYKGVLIASGRVSESWLILGVAVNGMAVMTTWKIYLMFVEMSILIGVEIEVCDPAHIPFIIFFILAGLFFATDITVLEPVTRFVLGPYLVMSIALISSLTLLFAPAEHSSRLNLVMAGVSVLALIIKVAVNIFNSGRGPVRQKLDYIPYFDLKRS